VSGISIEPGRDHLDAFVHTEGAELLRFAFLLTAGDTGVAEDIVQAVLTRLVERGVDDLADPRTYARRAVVNEWYTTQRRAVVNRRPWLGLPTGTIRRSRAQRTATPS
jgi:DNA-directed RNA polymerase specialized sigma24 family protein